ncbi:fumarylacetoacetase [Derxia lacustris]|uniref:fumarylacetoacetase n=1 Tax=Derxia lacustris TaxID=764842 RepID=UPI000A173D87|nr:fumarylacetoacetase [Derxia lacustris]
MTAYLPDATHAPTLTSWVASANDPASDFPIQNLPYGRFRHAGSKAPWRVGVAIGDAILDLTLAATAEGWSEAARAALEPLARGDLNAFMAAGVTVRRELRAALSRALAQGSAQQAALAGALLPQAEAEYALPCHIGDYTDFYTGIHHATTVGKLFRPDNPLLPNYKWVPIGYHGRSSSIGVSGQRFHRPLGQVKLPEAEVPVLAPSRRLDYELELGAFVGQPNALGEPVALADAEDHLFGVVLLNDWSARDVQAWEYQPLGPFLAKNFATTVSPWIVTMEALAPFRVPFTRPEGEPAPLPYLDGAANRERGALDLHFEVLIQTAQMREHGAAPVRLSRSNFRDAWWTLAQMLAHHTVGGCNLQPGDLLGSGTQSGPGADEAGSLLELSQGGRQPLALPNGETRTFLLDGDCIVLRGRCEADGARAIGFGDCIGTVLPARAAAA